MDNQATPTVTPTKTLLYWRKSLFSVKPSNVVPVILSLDQDGQFTMKTADNTKIIDSQARDLTVRFTGWGTMLIKTSDKEYAFTGVGASYSPDPSQEQIEEIKAVDGNNAAKDSNLTRVGAAGSALAGVGAAGAGASIAGSAASQYAYYQGLSSIRDWQHVFDQAGAKVTKSSMRFMMYFTLALAVIVVVGLIITLSAKQ